MREPSKGFSREIQVGIFIFAACLVIAAFSLRITDSPIFQKGTRLVAYFDDATGIFKNSKVKMAGIDIGSVKMIQLDHGKAKITLLINSGLKIPDNAEVVPRPLGILGDKYLEVVVPGPNDSSHGNPLKDEEATPPDRSSDAPSQSNDNKWAPTFESAALADDSSTQPPGSHKPAYKEGDVMKSQNSAGTIDDLTRQMGSVGQDLKAISSNLRKMVEGKEDVNSPLGRTLNNSEKLTANMNAMVEENRKDLHQLITSLNKTSSKIEKAFDQFDENKFKNDIKRLADAAGNVNKSLENVEQITNKINSGQGTLGKLVNDETTAVELNRSLRSINNLLDRTQRIQAVVDIRTEYNIGPSTAKTYVGLGIFPHEDSGYLAELVVDPAGTYDTTITTTNTNGGPPVTQQVVTQDENGLKFSLQYYRRLWNLGFRLGVFENTGGFAMDTYWWKDHIKATAELFDLSRDGLKPRLKVTLRANFFTYFYLNIGGDDLLNSGNALDSHHTLFAGLGLHFSDEDIKTIALFTGLL